MDRNFIMALVLSMAIVFGYQALFLAPKQRAYEAAQAEAAAAVPADTTVAGITDTVEALATNALPASREEAIARAPGRIRIDTPEMSGSLNLRGLTFDDITLKQYRETVSDESPMITILDPQAMASAQFLRSGISVNGDLGVDQIWSSETDAALTPATPVTLRRTEGAIQHVVNISVDEHFMFAIDYTIENRSENAIVAQPFGASYQKSIPDDLQNFMILFEGPLAIVGEKFHSKKYKKLQSNGAVVESGMGGWVGITDKYFLGAVIPPQDQTFQARLEQASRSATPVFRSQYVLDPVTVAPGQTFRTTSHVYAGAKEVDVLRDYQKPADKGGLGISRFDMAVDWGNFFIFTRPIFNTLHFFNGIVGNYGVAILLLTLCIKALLYPLANLSFKSMAGMRKAQPEMTRIRERYKDDQMKQQQEMAAVFKKYNINPAAGCLPIFAQMPIFYALYKTLFVTIEMRHEPFLYIQDLAQRDPTSIFNLFGIIPFEPTAIPVIGTFLGIGVLPLIMGAAMWVQMKLNPPPTDPMQAKIFAFMPLIFLFMFAPFAAGLVLYWAWNTTLSVMQQYVIMKRNGADVDLISNIKQALPFLSKKPATNDNKSS